MLIEYYALDKTMKEVAQTVGLSESRVSQIIDKLHKRLNSLGEKVQDALC